VQSIEHHRHGRTTIYKSYMLHPGKNAILAHISAVGIVVERKRALLGTAPSSR
jgi:hypothetical protein